MHANLELTRLCNQRCVYCFNSSSPERHNARMVIDWSGVIDTLGARGFKSVHFTGGEPFLVSGLLSLMRKALNREFKISVLSNGHNIPRLLADPAARDVLTRMQVAQVSLDSMDLDVHDRRRGKTGAWASAAAAIQALSKSRIPVEISCVVDEENDEGVEEVALFARELGARLIVRPRVRAGRAAGGRRYSISENLRAALQRFGDVLTHDRFHYVPRDGGDDDAPRGVVTLMADGYIRGDLTLFPEPVRFDSDGGLVAA